VIFLLFSHWISVPTTGKQISVIAVLSFVAIFLWTLPFSFFLDKKRNKKIKGCGKKS